jgi:hypothetical protein
MNLKQIGWEVVDWMDLVQGRGCPTGRDLWEDLGAGERVTLRWTLGRQGSMGANWIQLAQDRVQW